jgi:hypothetical protein
MWQGIYGYALGIGSFTATIPGHPVDNYYLSTGCQELWQRKQTSPLGYALGIGSFTAIIPGHPVDNYYIVNGQS